MKITKRRLTEKPLSYSEEQALQREKKMLEDVRDEVEIRQGIKHEVQDEAAVEERIKAIDKTLEKSADRATGAERGELEKREKELRAYLQKDSATWNDHTRLRPSDGIRYSEYVDGLVTQMKDPHRARLVEEWKGIRRRLDPENPRASDTRYLFRQ
jgi:hypothetical protein